MIQATKLDLFANENNVSPERGYISGLDASWAEGEGRESEKDWSVRGSRQRG